MDKGKDKVKKICDILRRDTLEPAQREAGEIIARAQQEAEKLIKEARLLAQKIEVEAHSEVERQKQILHSSLVQATQQVVESLKQRIEEKLFVPGLTRLLAEQMQDPQVIVQLIQAVVQAIHKEGLDTNLSVYVPAVVPPKAVNGLLAGDVLNRLKEKSVLIGPMAGGIEVRLHDEDVTIDISDLTIKEMVASYIRKDFRELLFGR